MQVCNYLKNAGVQAALLEKRLHHRRFKGDEEYTRLKRAIDDIQNLFLEIP